MTDLNWLLNEIISLHEMRHVSVLKRELLNYKTAIKEPDSRTSAPLARMKADAQDWAKIEDTFGAGATLKLEDPRVQRLDRMAPYLKVIPTSHFECAKRFQETELYGSLFLSDHLQ